MNGMTCVYSCLCMRCEQFPKVLRASARVHLIQSREHILNTYSEHISKYAEQKFARDEVDIIVNARVKRVEPDAVIYSKSLGCVYPGPGRLINMLLHHLVRS